MTASTTFSSENTLKGFFKRACHGHAAYPCISRWEKQLAVALLAMAVRSVLARLVLTGLLFAIPWCHAVAAEACPGPASVFGRTLCDQPPLQLLHDSLARRFDRWQQHCATNRPAHTKKFLSHEAWINELRVSFGRLEGVAPTDFLGSAFTERADRLAEALSLCARHLGPAVRALHTDTVRLPPTKGQDEGDNLLFVRTDPPLVGMRINDVLFGEAPTSPREADVLKAFASSRLPLPDDDEGNSTSTVSVLWRNPRVLVLKIDSSGCEIRCWQYSQLLMFDLRTGDSVNADDLLNAPGRGKLDSLGEGSVLKEVAMLRRREAPSWESDGRDAFDHCIRQWREWRYRDGRQIVWLTHGRWHVRGPECAGDSDPMPPSIDGKDFPMSALAPYLSNYGRSLLLGQGDVRTPELQLAACTAGVPPDPHGWAARIAEISAGSEHVFLREASGRVWGWGDNYTGALGKGDHVAPPVAGLHRSCLVTTMCMPVLGKVSALP